ncbi:MAG: hypothetical protein AAFV53_05415 [Myxococcota bacterium]
MKNNDPFDPNSSSRQLIRLLRIQPDRMEDAPEALPESVLWQIYCELRRRGEKDAADVHFLRSIDRLLKRRAIKVADLPTHDAAPDEHKLVDDPMLSELWRAYKRCICNGRPGTASQLLRDIKAQLAES